MTATTIQNVLRGTLSYEDGLDALTVAPARETEAELGAAVAEAVDRLFRSGWQPAELYRVIARLGNPLQAQQVAEVAKGYIGKFPDIDPRWRAQAEELPAATSRSDRIKALDAGLALLLELRTLPAIDKLIPAPGEAPEKRLRGA